MAQKVSGPRCAAIVGSYGSGKTTLFEDMLFTAGAIDRRGTVKDGNTIGDGATEARSRSMSTELSLANLNYLGDPWTLIDCPGSVELSYHTQCALMVSDIAVVVCEPTPERAVIVSSTLKFLDDHKIPHVLYINKMDHTEASVRATLEALQAVSDRPLVLREIPMRNADGEITGMADLVSERAWKWNEHKPSDLISLPEEIKDDEGQARYEMLEALADFDDGIMEELLEDVVPSTDEIYKNLTSDLQRDLIVPVFFGSAENENGINRLLKALRHETPEVGTTADRLEIDTSGGTVAQIFKTVHAGQSGKLSLTRVWSGEVADGMTLGEDRVGGVNTLFGKKSTRTNVAKAGEIVALGRMGNSVTGDVLVEGGKMPNDWIAPPSPLFSVAIQAEKQADEVKLASALTKLVEEDPSLSVDHRMETGELVLSGQGEVHLQIAISRMKNEYGLAVSQAQPSVPYKETISKGAKQHARHRKQSGGHGEYADVHLEIQPLPRGSGFVFADTITGGAVPKQYIPAVKRGVEAYLQRGPLGFPVVDIAVTLTDGGFHAVDSSDMAFQKAAVQAMSEAMPSCRPVLLEPVVKTTVSVPSEYTPRAQRTISGRRGQLLGFDTKENWKGWDEVLAEMPQTEIGDLIVELRSISLGVGTYSFEFDHLTEIYGTNANKVIEARKADSSRH